VSVFAAGQARALALRKAAVVLVLAVASVGVVKAGHASHAQERAIASKLAESKVLARRWQQYRSAGVAAAKNQPGSLNLARLRYLGRPEARRYLAPLAGARRSGFRFTRRRSSRRSRSCSSPGTWSVS
jgi:hypothetical protein